jgi:hypothetical protein
MRDRQYCSFQERRHRHAKGFGTRGHREDGTLYFFILFSMCFSVASTCFSEAAISCNAAHQVRGNATGGRGTEVLGHG